MPCYRIVVVSVEFKVESAERLKKALERLGFEVRKYKGNLNAADRRGVFDFDLEKGKINFQRGLEGRVNEIKREYSKVSLEEITKKKKWFLKEKKKNIYDVVKY
uniref:Uncharacterized protein n=1 Tax=viral metagenome TaxID=1070528 RepID=A0A6M3LC79_9ZZZZ